MRRQDEPSRAPAVESSGNLIEMHNLDSRTENRLRSIEEQMLLKRRVSDAEPEGKDGQVTWKQRLRQ